MLLNELLCKQRKIKRKNELNFFHELKLNYAFQPFKMLDETNFIKVNLWKKFNSFYLACFSN